ncbi:uncharacterized protein [Parasteatoda tepidariorum]|uniref:uncharacterized protein isoform X2 n=1 Tax=Parasteatoda tepidariorum TaxID=114398 RepID=UPI00077FADA3|nr:uncharacterized protein LOC107447226 isoform X2 [Parasteatoda tepidariorum]
MLFFINYTVHCVEIQTTSDNSGTCFLFVRDQTSPASVLPCNVNIYINGGVSAYATVMTIYHGYGTLVASRGESHVGRTMWVMPWLLANSLSMIVVFISSCIYSIGLYVSCTNDTPVLSLTESCSMDNKIFKTMFISEICAWLNVFFWICLIVLEAVRLRRNRRAISREIYQDPNSSDVVNIGVINPTA